MSSTHGCRFPKIRPFYQPFLSPFSALRTRVNCAGSKTTAYPLPHLDLERLKPYPAPINLSVTFQVQLSSPIASALKFPDSPGSLLTGNTTVYI